MKRRLTKEELHNLRRDIKLGSLYYHDYRNRYGIDERDVCDFFDGYWSYIEEEATECGDLTSDMVHDDYYDAIFKNDTDENLEGWYYYMLEETPVMIDELDGEYATA